jgi:ABC-type sugar transport system permease subunit
MIYLKLISLLLTLTIIGCTTDPSEKYENLSKEQKEIVFAELESKIVNNQICQRFKEDINRFKEDLLNKDLDPSWFYFKEYPFQFKSFVRNPFSDALVMTFLRSDGVRNYSVNLKNYPTPRIDELPCQELISLWQIERDKSELLRNSLPSEFYKQYSDFDYYYDEFSKWLKSALTYTVVFLITVAVSAYAFALHFALVVKKNKEGLWFIIPTPFASFLIQGHIYHFKNKNFFDVPDFWEIIFTSSIIFSVTSIFLCLIYLKVSKK